MGLVCRTEDYGKRSGTAYTIASFGTLIGIPRALASWLEIEHRSPSIRDMAAFRVHQCKTDNLTIQTEGE